MMSSDAARTALKTAIEFSTGSVVDRENLEKANSRMWSAESLTNSFIGPPLGSLIIGVAIYLPFFVDAGSFFVAVALIASISGSFKPVHETPREKINFKAEIKEGFTWLWTHSLLDISELYFETSFCSPICSRNFIEAPAITVAINPPTYIGRRRL